jgi:glycosyltransferase involved in cell wall biosynthesis
MNYLVRYGADPNGIFVIPYIPAMPGISMPPSKNEKSVLRKQYGLAEDTPVILWVGRMIPRKRLDDLFSAIVMLGRATDVQVVIVGSGPEEEALRGMQKRMMLDNVHFVGPKSQKDLPGFYRMADVFVYPSSDEPFGAVIPEAMTFGLPIVTTDVVGGSADFLIDGQNGFIVPHGKVLSLSRALSQILTDEQLRYRMGVESLKIMGRYSIEKNVTTLMGAINYALRKKRARS